MEDGLAKLKDEENSPKTLEIVIREVVLVKYSDAAERELVKIRANDTFGVSL